MAFLYKYLEAENIPRYVGIVRGDSIWDLDRRIYQHSREESFQPSWTIEFVRDLSLSDADLLETYFVRKWADTLINKAKRSDGALTVELSSEHELHWIVWEPDVLLPTTPRQIENFFNRQSRMGEELFKTPCARCGNTGSRFEFNLCVETTLEKRPSREKDRYDEKYIWGKHLCQECYEEFCALWKSFFDTPYHNASDRRIRENMIAIPIDEDDYV